MSIVHRHVAPATASAPLFRIRDVLSFCGPATPRRVLLLWLLLTAAWRVGRFLRRVLLASAGLVHRWPACLAFLLCLSRL
jgi:hypothetical protein